MLVILILVQICFLVSTYMLGKQRGIIEAEKTLVRAYEEGHLKGVIEAIVESYEEDS